MSKDKVEEDKAGSGSPSPTPSPSTTENDSNSKEEVTDKDKDNKDKDKDEKQEEKADGGGDALLKAPATPDASEEQMRFSEGEKVLCFHGPLIYEAKVMKAQPGGKYRIHYNGWNKKWDEWVREK